MKLIQLLNPGKVVFGDNALDRFISDFLASGRKRLYLVTIAPLEGHLSARLAALEAGGIAVKKDISIRDEPTFDDFERLISDARTFDADSVAGIGGGSVMDTAKLIAAQLHNAQTIDDILANGFAKHRDTYLACIPTTSGTGSEVSPNAIFVNSAGNKTGVISPELVPDAAYIDPVLTLGVPSSVTAATGIDALAHCLEAYTNKFAHPVIDLVALEGIRLIGSFLERACKEGSDLEARTQVALGSMYGGMCLGPVNTAAVHALAYPLSTEFHIPHGLSVALLLPYVMEFNAVANPDRYAAVAVALGVEAKGETLEVALLGAKRIKELVSACGLPAGLAEAGVPLTAVPKMAVAAVQIQRLMKNNPREISTEDAENIYSNAFNKTVNE